MWHRGLREAIQHANNMNSDSNKHGVTPLPLPKIKLRSGFTTISTDFM